MKTRTKIRRLKKLVKIVKRVRHSDVEFDMRVWARRDDDGDVRACALGLAGLNKGFRAKGFETTVGKVGTENSLGAVQYRGRSGSSAAIKFFGIDWEQAEHLADSWHYDIPGKVKPTHVVKYIKTLIREIREAA